MYFSFRQLFFPSNNSKTNETFYTKYQAIIISQLHNELIPENLLSEYSTFLSSVRSGGLFLSKKRKSISYHCNYEVQMHVTSTRPASSTTNFHIHKSQRHKLPILMSCLWNNLLATDFYQRCDIGSFENSVKSPDE